VADGERIRQDSEKKRKIAEDQSKKAIEQTRLLEEQIKKAKADEAVRLAEEQKKAKEAEEKRKVAEAELARLAEATKKAAALAGQQKSAESEKARKDAEEKQKLAEMETAKLRAQIEEANRLNAKRAEDEKKKADEAEKKRAVAEKEAARLNAEVQRARDAATKETQRMADARLKQIQIDIEAKEAAARAAAAAAKTKLDEEAKKLALLTETKRKADEARKNIEAEAAKFQPGKPWQNSLGMKFVPVGSVAVGVWETRVDDYEQFINATRYDSGAGWRDPGFKQPTTSHPVLNVSWNDAQAFCKWLTDKERKAGLIGANVSYRLPTDAEWSQAVRLDGESGATPVDKDLRVKAHYPWGTAWPPPIGAGNYADSVSYDGFENTAPVGSFRPNGLGLYDLGGNAWEWCDDWSDGGKKDRVLRGGSYAGYVGGSLFSSYRRTAAPADRNNDTGFRCVIDAGR
jgi:formylglycine-generating enzyme required for sulfatase activity